MIQNRTIEGKVICMDTRQLQNELNRQKAKVVLIYESLQIPKMLIELAKKKGVAITLTW